MHNFVSTYDNKQIVEDLNGLISIDYQTMDLYDQAAQEVHNAAYQSTLETFRQETLRHIQELTNAIEQLGGEPTQQKKAKHLQLDDLNDSEILHDADVLEQIKQNEIKVNVLYERFFQKYAGKLEINCLLKNGLDDERRHKKWLKTTIAALKEDEFEQVTFVP